MMPSHTMQIGIDRASTASLGLRTSQDVTDARSTVGARLNQNQLTSKWNIRGSYAAYGAQFMIGSSHVSAVVTEIISSVGVGLPRRRDWKIAVPQTAKNMTSEPISK